MRASSLFCSVATVMFWSGSASGSLIPGFGLQSSPDITTGFVDVTYNAATDQFVALDSALTYDPGSGAQPIIGGAFSISAVINGGGLPVSGSLLISGSIPSGPFSDPLLAGSLLDFGFVDGGGDIFQFIFSVSGGSLAGQYGGLGALFGVLLDSNIVGGYSGDWSQSFSNLVGGQSGTGTGLANVAPIPGPAALACFLVVAAFGNRRGRSSRQDA